MIGGVLECNHQATWCMVLLLDQSWLLTNASKATMSMVTRITVRDNLIPPIRFIQQEYFIFIWQKMKRNVLVHLRSQAEWSLRNRNSYWCMILPWTILKRYMARIVAATNQIHPGWNIRTLCRWNWKRMLMQNHMGYELYNFSNYPMSYSIVLRVLLPKGEVRPLLQCLTI